VVTGTGTEVGKTWAAAAVLSLARQSGWSVAARKPVQSFQPGAGPTDADVLAGASGERSEQVCPTYRSYPLPLAPPMAAEKLGIPPPTTAELVDEIDGSWPSLPVDLGLIEGAGGVASPLAVDGDTAELARRLSADAVVVVADPNLGVIHSVRLTRLALPAVPMVVYLNRFDPGQDLHRSNLDWLSNRDRLTVVTTPTHLLERVARRRA
jgi:dethiobiotin synthetase